ncbi:hypothetical protein B8A44_08150 [Dolosigranulum pigrum]|uniref:Phage head morphogenesis domain-containing protein n=1 Tax=Dolosigranulum pigrum TaxID=29394 RepID=A0A328KPD2_9LACT|nr:minor capsid protein [Dolosigranulum pigrum]RAN62233.1 hypothetical protein B8A44_08150 [Dolosigranulum pigrum]
MARLKFGAVDEISDKKLKQKLYNLERKHDNELAKRHINREQLIREYFQRSTNLMRENLERYYMRYASAEGITVAEAKKRASEFDVRKYEKRAAQAVRERDFTPDTNAWLKLYNLKMRASREEVMLAQANLTMIELYDDVEKLGLSAMTEEGMREAQRQAGILGGQPITAEEVQKLVNADFYGNNFSEKIWGRHGHFHKLQRELRNAMTDMHVNMDGYRKNWQYLARRMQVAESHAERLIKTEERRIISDTQKAMYKKHDFEHYIYVAEADACEECAPLDGLIFKTEDADQGINFPVMHPNCRCSTYGKHLMEEIEIDE